MRITAGILCAVFMLLFASYAFAAETSQPSDTATRQGDSFHDNTIPSDSSIVTTPTSDIVIRLTTIEEIEKIGKDAGYPLDGQYELMNDIDGQDLPFNPIGSIEEPFTGVFNGNKCKISNLTIHSNDENSGLFVHFKGTLSSLNLQNIKVKASAVTGSLFGTVSGEADISDVFVTGTMVADEAQEQEAGIIGGLAGKIENAKRIENAAVFVNIGQQGKLTGAIAGENSAQADIFKDCLWSSVYGQDNALGLDSGINQSDGISKVETDPTYLALMTGGEAATVKADVDKADRYGLVFRGFILNDKTILDISGINDNRATVSPKRETGAAQLITLYEKTYSDSTKDEIRFATPVIVSQDINEPVQLKPVDPVFPTQIEEVKKLDSLLPTEIEDKTVEITTWEQFKNIGNTAYDERYTMEADYVLGADIMADSAEFQPIGTQDAPFTGTFDGNGYSIDISANPNIDNEAEFHGLFGVVRQKS